jgi:hypothetical protein
MLKINDGSNKYKNVDIGASKGWGLPGCSPHKAKLKKKKNRSCRYDVIKGFT